MIDQGGAPGAGFGSPGTLRAGRVAVTYMTYGSSSCTRPAGEQYQYEGNTITVTSFDEAVPPGVPCTDDLAAHQRTATVTLVPGPAVLRLRGLRRGEVGIIETAIVVEP